MCHLKIKTRDLMLKSRVLKVICPLKIHFSLKVIPQHLNNGWKTADYDQVYLLLYKARGLRPPRPPEAAG